MSEYMLYKEYFSTLNNPTIEKINKTIDLFNLAIFELETDALSNYKGHRVWNENDEKTLQALKLYEDRVTELYRIRRKLEKNKTIHCDICKLDEKGLEIPNSPIKVCLKCIYSTVLEHQTKKEWMTDMETQNKNKDDK